MLYCRFRDYAIFAATPVCSMATPPPRMPPDIARRHCRHATPRYYFIYDAPMPPMLIFIFIHFP
jgi:hypothetical protein